MNKLITLLLCSALGACASPKTEEAPPPMETTADAPELVVEIAAVEVEASLPEVRYYVISDG
jgi:hypothetical protein